MLKSFIKLTETSLIALAVFLDFIVRNHIAFVNSFNIFVAQLNLSFDKHVYDELIDEQFQLNSRKSQTLIPMNQRIQLKQPSAQSTF